MARNPPQSYARNSGPDALTAIPRAVKIRNGLLDTPCPGTCKNFSPMVDVPELGTGMEKTRHKLRSCDGCSYSADWCFSSL